MLVVGFALVVVGCGGQGAGSDGNAAAASSNVSTATLPPRSDAAGPLPATQVQDLRTAVDISFTDETDCGGTPCTVPGDVLAPKDAAALPTVVLVGGDTAFEERRYQERLAIALADRGAVVFLMAYRASSTGNFESDAFNDLRCAVRFARATTADYGGDPSRVVLIGHSRGGANALYIATQPEEEATACLSDGSGRPDGVVALGPPGPSLTGADDGGPPLWLYAGSEDADVDGIAERLRAAGFEAEARELPGIDHLGITDPVNHPEVVDLIFEALDAVPASSTSP